MHNVTLIPGDGIGQEVTKATKEVIDFLGVNINWDIQEAGETAIQKYGSPLPNGVIESIKIMGLHLKDQLQHL